MVLRTLYLGLKRRDEPHRRLARWTFPLWLYVSVTGVVIYVMLYQLYPPGRIRIDWSHDAGQRLEAVSPGAGASAPSDGAAARARLRLPALQGGGRRRRREPGSWRGMYWSILLMIADAVQHVGVMVLMIVRARRRRQPGLPAGARS